jgi:hypothetical protein
VPGGRPPGRTVQFPGGPPPGTLSLLPSEAIAETGAGTHDSAPTAALAENLIG